MHINAERRYVRTNNKGEERMQSPPHAYTYKIIPLFMTYGVKDEEEVLRSMENSLFWRNRIFGIIKNKKGRK